MMDIYRIYVLHSLQVCSTVSLVVKNKVASTYCSKTPREECVILTRTYACKPPLPGKGTFGRSNMFPIITSSELDTLWLC